MSLDNDNFGLTIDGLSTVDYDVSILPQKKGLLKRVACRVDYRKSIAKRKIKLNYDDKKARRLYSTDHVIP